MVVWLLPKDKSWASRIISFFTESNLNLISLIFPLNKPIILTASDNSFLFKIILFSNSLGIIDEYLG